MLTDWIVAGAALLFDVVLIGYLYHRVKKRDEEMDSRYRE